MIFLIKLEKISQSFEISFDPIVFEPALLSYKSFIHFLFFQSVYTQYL
jgi:hypothetical protein